MVLHLVNLSEEWEMFRVFDAMSFENEEADKFETGFSTNGEFSEEQSVELGNLVWLIVLSIPQNAAQSLILGGNKLESIR